MPPDVEFLPDPGDDPARDRPGDPARTAQHDPDAHPSTAGGFWSARRRTGAGLVVAAVLAGAGIWVATQGDGGGPAADTPGPTVTVVVPASSSSATRRSSASGVSAAPGPSVSASVSRPGGPTGLPRIICHMGTKVNIAVAQAIRAAFPAAKVNKSQSYICARGSGIDEITASEAVRARSARFDLVVALTARGAVGRGSSLFGSTVIPRADFDLVAGLRSETAAFDFQIQVFGRPGTAPSTDQLRTLENALGYGVVM